MSNNENTATLKTAASFSSELNENLIPLSIKRVAISKARLKSSSLSRMNRAREQRRAIMAKYHSELGIKVNKALREKKRDKQPIFQ